MMVGDASRAPLKPCCSVPRRAPRRVQLTINSKLCSQCQTEQTDDESEATEEGSDISSRQVGEGHALQNQMPETAITTEPTRPSGTVCISQDHDISSIVTARSLASSQEMLQSQFTPSAKPIHVYRVGFETPPPNSLQAPSKPLKSSLRKSKGNKSASGQTKRRVRGLWNENCACSFTELHDDVLLLMLSYLSMSDLYKASMVCSRWNYLTTLPSAWKYVDATDFVQKTNAHFVRASPDTSLEITCQHLAARLQPYAPEKLIIRSIEHSLTADIYLPPLQGLQELTLTGFADLSDTHVHVMLLSSAVTADVRARSKRDNFLSKLAMEQCPLLTNASIRSIALHCPNLIELSLRGNRQLYNLAPLKNAWKVPEPARGRMSHSQSAASLAVASMASLFSPPQSLPPPPPLPATLLERPSTPPPSATPPLVSLFALPGNSPPRRILFVQSASPAGKLTRVDFSNTKVTASSLVDSLEAAPGVVELESLKMRGSGESWRDAHFKSLVDKVDVSKLLHLDISCANSYAGATTITDVSLGCLSSTVGGLALQKLELAGHRSLRAAGIAKLLSAALDLIELDLEGCKGVGCKADSSGTIALARTLMQHGGSKGGLKRLSLARCFSNKKASSALTSKNFAAETKRGNVLIKTLCKSHSNRTLEHIDLRGCWFVTLEDETLLRQHCPRLVTLQLAGTRCTRID